MRQAATIPFVDLRAQYESLKEELQGAIQGVLERSDYVRGAEVTRFEEEFAEFVGARHCISCGNGSDAIELILEAWNIGPGDEVIVPAITWITTASAASRRGAKVVFVDLDPQYYTMDLSKVAAAITPRTKVVIPVHLYGLPVEMDGLLALTRPLGIRVLEDCAHAHGARYKGRRVGAFGNAAAFSFYPGKNLGAYGDAGAITTEDDKLAVLLRRLGNHGTLAKHDHEIEGRNSRLDTLQAAILRVKLRHLQRWVELRRQHAQSYIEILRGASLQVPVWPAHSEHAFHVFAIQISGRDELREHLKQGGIESNIHYPVPLPLVPAYMAKQRATAEEFPVAFAQSQRLVSLPMFPELTRPVIQRVCDEVKRFQAKGMTRAGQSRPGRSE